uniref:WRC domain-containing protein n=1 Tax=Oryza brachyantha TaxID=4533 RepID=J3LCX9_ORYBR
MRIRRSAARVLGSAYFASRVDVSGNNLSPELTMVGPIVHGGGGGPSNPMGTIEGVCILSQSPWDLPYETDNPNPLEDPFDKYMVRIPHRASFTFNNDNNDKMYVDDILEQKKQEEDEEVKDHKTAHKEKQGDDIGMKKTMNKETSMQEEKDMVVEEMENNDERQAGVWYCHKNDGKRWHCRNIVDGPKTLCDYHLAKSRSYYAPTGEKGALASSKSSNTKTSTTRFSLPKSTAPAASSKASAIGKAALAKPSCRSRPTTAGAASSSKAVAPGKSKAATSSTRPTSQRRKRKSTNGNGNGNGSCGDYYFYDLFGPFRGKDRRNSSSHRPASAGAEDEEHLQQQQHNNLDGDNLSNESSITGGDKENDGDYVVRGGGAGNGKGKGKMSAVEKVQFPKITKKRIKERSLKSLL